MRQTGWLLLAMLAVWGVELPEAVGQVTDSQSRVDTAGTGTTNQSGELHDTNARLGEVSVAMLVYSDGMREMCFSQAFLTAVTRHTEIQIAPRFETAQLNGEDIFEFPLLVMSGQGPFELSSQEKVNLKAYLSRGGFLLASAGCSNEAWALSFESLMAELFPQQSLKGLGLDHPIFHMVFDIERVTTRKPTTMGAVVYGLATAGRLIAVYSPVGLNDTANAGMGCCCCGGNEIRNARQINANILAYVLTH